MSYTVRGFSHLFFVKALIILTSLNAVVRSSLAGMVLGPLPNIRLLMHNQGHIDEMIRSKRDSLCNHEHSGASSIDENPSVPDSFRCLSESITVGHGLKDFQRASEFMFAFEMINALPWAKVALSTETMETGIVVGSVLCTLVKCYKSAWTLNPCRVCYINRSSDKRQPKNLLPKRRGVKQVDEIAYSTLDGHLIAGEERFRVSLMKNDDVIFDIYSFTKGAGAVGTVAMPFIRPIQAVFFRDAVRSMKKIMAQK